MRKFATKLYQGRGGKVFFVLAVLVILFILFYAFSYYLQSRTSNDAGGKEIVSTPVIKESPKKEDSFPTIERETNFSSIQISYPKIPGSSVAVQEGNKLISKRFQDAANLFDKEAEQGEEENKDLPQDLPKSDFVAETKKVFEDSNVISYVIEEMFYSRGAAHPSHKSITYVFDKNKEKMLSLSDVFTLSDAFYKTLISLVSSKLQIQLEKTMETKLDKSGTDWIQDGLSKKEQSFGKFTLTNNNITFYFDEYTVAPYVAGEQQITVSYDELKAFKK